MNEEVMRLLSDVVPIEDLVVPRDSNGHGRGYGFAYLKNEEDVEQALAHLDLRELRGRPVRVTRELQLDPESKRPLTLQEKRDHLALMRRKMLASLYQYKAGQNTEPVLQNYLQRFGALFKDHEDKEKRLAELLDKNNPELQEYVEELHTSAESAHEQFIEDMEKNRDSYPTLHEFQRAYHSYCERYNVPLETRCKRAKSDNDI